MLHFRDGRRQNRAMALLMENLSDGYLAELAAYFSTLPATYLPVSANAAHAESRPAPALVGRAIPRGKFPPVRTVTATRCSVWRRPFPGLLGLPADYLSAQFGAWKGESARRAAAPDCMADIARQLTEREVSEMANWLATRPLPADSRPAKALAAALPMQCGSVTAPAVKP